MTDPACRCVPGGPCPHKHGHPAFYDWCSRCRRILRRHARPWWGG